MAKLTKRAKAASAAVDREKLYGVDEAIKIIKDLASKSKFDETLDIAINLGVDPRHADQMVRGVISLPAGTGKEKMRAPHTDTHVRVSRCVLASLPCSPLYGCTVFCGCSVFAD